MQGLLHVFAKWDYAYEVKYNGLGEIIKAEKKRILLRMNAASENYLIYSFLEYNIQIIIKSAYYIFVLLCI